MGACYQMGRTVPSFRNVLAEEKAEWRPFRNALGKKDRKEFDEIWDIPRLYLSACSNSVQLVPLQPIVMSILFHHYKELKKCMEDVKQLEEGVSSKAKRELLVNERTQKGELQPIITTIDSYFFNNQERG